MTGLRPHSCQGTEPGSDPCSLAEERCLCLGPESRSVASRPHGSVQQMLFSRKRAGTTRMWSE